MKQWASVAMAILFATVSATGLRAQADVENIQQVIQGQWDAFAHDDAEKAFSFASPAAQDLFSTAPYFMSMVEQGYPMVYRHTTVKFLKAVIGDSFGLQVVRMADLSGVNWYVLYRLSRVDDGWKIDGVLVFPEGEVPELEAPPTEL